MSNTRSKLLVIQHGTLINGAGGPAAPNEALVIDGNRIRSTGPLPADVQLEDQAQVQVINATGQWVVPG